MAVGVAFEDGIHPQFVTRGIAVVGECVEHAARLFDREHDVAGDGGAAELVRAEFERSHDAEVAAAALQCPEQIGILLGAGLHQLAVRGDHVRADHAVDGEAELALQATDATAEREARDAGVRDGAGGHHEPEGLGFTIQRA